MCNSVTSRTAGRELNKRDNEHFFKCRIKCCTSCSYCARAFSKERNKSRGSSLSLQKKQIKICERCFLCHSIVFCKTCNKCSQCCHKSACRGQTSKLLEKLAGSGCWSESSSNPQRGLRPPLLDPAELGKVSHSHKLLWQSSQELNLLEALHQLMDKNAIELVHKQNSLVFFNRLFLVPKPNNKWRPILDLSNLNLFLKAEKFKMETPETIRTSLQQGEWVTSIDFKDAYFHIPIQEQSRKYLRFHVQGQTYQFKALPFGLSTAPMEFTVIAKEVKLMAIHKGIRIHQYLDDWLVRATSHRLSRTYTGPSKSVPGIGVAGERRKVRTGTEASFQLCRLPGQPRVRSGPTHTGPVAKPSGKNTETSIPTGLSDPGVHVLDRSVNSHRKAGSPRPTAHEAHSVAPQKQLEDTGIPRKDDSHTQVPASTLTMMANRRQYSHRSTITPNKRCSADLYRRIKRRVGRSLKRTHSQRNLVPPGKQAAYKLPRTQGSFSNFKRVSRPLHKQDGSSSNRQHYSSVLHKQRRRDEIGPSVRPTLENLDLVLQETSDFKGPTHPRPTECGGRQAIQTRPDHLDRMVPPSRGVSDNMQQVAPATDRPFCYEVQQQVASVCVTSAGSPGHCSRFTQSAMGGSGRICLPTSGHLGQSGGEAAKLPLQKIDSYCPGMAQHALVL